MDVNGTHYQLIAGKEDWANCVGLNREHLGLYWDSSSPPISPDVSGLAWDEERFELTLQPRLFQFASKGQALPLENRRGAARDRNGNWYWIDQTDSSIEVNSVGSGVGSHFWSVGDGAFLPATRLGDFQSSQVTPPPTPLALSGLAVTSEHYLVVGVLEPAGLLIFDLYKGGSPRQMLWPAEIPFVPFDMTPAPNGGVWILDRENRHYWALDRSLNVIRQEQIELLLTPGQQEVFQPADGRSLRQTAPHKFPQGIELTAAFTLAALDPIAIEALPDNTVLILDRPAGQKFSRIYHYRFGQQLGQPISTDVMLKVIEPEEQPAFQLRGYDMAFVPEQATADGKLFDHLYIVGENGTQTYAFYVSQRGDQLDLRPLTTYLPMRQFGGKALVAAAGQLYYDFRDLWLPLVKQNRPRYVESATFYTPAGKPRHAFDGKEPDCVWHRLMLEACIPPNTSVEIWSRAANQESDLEITGWQLEPRPYLRSNGSELPFVNNISGLGTWELLFQKATGQYLQLKLILRGNEQNTPHLRALRAYYPRFSYLNHYLPAVYREDNLSASFLDRFLANVEGFYTAIEDKIGAVQMLFDVRSAPPESLDWLAGWFGIALDPAWNETKQRLFIQHAMDFFQWRGTLRGLEMALRLVFEDCADASIFTDQPDQQTRPGSIRIVEKFRTRRVPSVVFGDPNEVVGLRQFANSNKWQPAQGSAELIKLFKIETNLSFWSLKDPANETSVSWQNFMQRHLGFVPVTDDHALQLWRDFLARRYQTIRALNTVYYTDWDDFSQVALPDQLPPDRAPLTDWYQFQSVVLAMHRTAHRFSVVLPTPRLQDGSLSNQLHQDQLNLATRLLNLEKPAHTVFEVKFYWALFRVGEARLGSDTLIELGSRAPQLLPPLVLGQNYLSESYIAPGYPYEVTNRQILGRDRINSQGEFL